MKFKCIVEYEYPIEHKPPVKAEIVLHGDRVVTDKIIQLPKGHGRLKDVDWIDDNCENHYSDKDGSWCYTWRDIDNAPTIIEADKGENK